MIKQNLILIVSVMLFGLTSQAQFSSSTLDLIIGFQYSKSKSVHFIEGEKGILKSKVNVGEPVFFVSVNTDTDIFFIQTRHSIFKGIISTGEITAQNRVYEKGETIKNVNLDNLIIPHGVNIDGVALWSYNQELAAAQKEMLNTSNVFKITKLSNRVNEMLQAPTPYVLYDFNTASFEDYGAFRLTEKYPMSLQSDDTIWFNSMSSGELTLVNRKTNEIMTSFDTKAPLKTNPKHMNLANLNSIPAIVNDNLFAVTFFGTNPNNPKETLTLLCNNKLRRVVAESKGTQSAALSYPLVFTDSDSYVYGKSKSNFNKPEPQMPPQPKIGAFGAKKKLKEYQAKLDVYTADYQAWITESYLPEHVDIHIYKDPKTEENPLLIIKGAANAHVFNNTNAFVVKKNAYVMYDLGDGSEKWRIDI